MSPQPLRFDPIREARRQWELRWDDDPARAMAAVAGLMRVQQILLASLNDALRPLGLTFARYEALMLLSFSSRGSMPLGKVGERLQVHRASVTNIIDRLEAAGYVVRRAADRRTTLAEITESGRRVAEEATALLNGMGFTVPGLSADELEALIALMTKVRREAGDFEEPEPIG
jgi:DNA-binding MarR family transcriptional regulator